MTDYITLDAYANRYRITVSDKDVAIAEHISAACGRVRAITHRDFSPHEGAATVRYFKPTTCDVVYINDAYDITAVGVDDADDGTWSTAWTVDTDFETDPANGIGENGESGFPVTTLRAVGSKRFPTWTSRRAVKVTAKWGWEAIPASVVEATYLLTRRLAYEVGVPGGVTPPNLDVGLPGSPLQRPWTAEDLLKPYIDKDVGIA